MSVTIRVDCTDEKVTVLVRKGATHITEFTAGEYPDHLEPWERIDWLYKQLPVSKSILFAVIVAVDSVLGLLADDDDDDDDEIDAQMQKSATSH